MHCLDMWGGCSVIRTFEAIKQVKRKIIRCAFFITDHCSEMIREGTHAIMRSGLLKLCVLLWIPALLFAGCGDKEAAYFQGYVEGEYVYAASAGQGELTGLFVEKGQRVEKNVPLFQLDPNPETFQIEEISKRIEQAEARFADIGKGYRPSEIAAIKARLEKAKLAFELAGRDYQRRLKANETRKGDIVSEEAMDRFRTEVNLRRADVEAIEAELKTAGLGGRADAVNAVKAEIDALTASKNTLEWQLGKKRVTSPSAGTVHDIIYRVGEIVPAGRPVVSLLPDENLKIRFFVPQSQLSSIRLGEKVRLNMDGEASPFTAEITYISPEAEFTPPVIYSRESRSKLVFMIEAAPEKSALASLHVGQPLEVSRK